MNAYRLPQPAMADVLIGRDTELAHLLATVRQNPGVVVTIVGPGGVGKTRLAHAVQDTLAATQEVRFVHLAPVAHVDLVPGMIAAACGYQVPAGELAWPALFRLLATEPVLLILDNLEHLPDLSGPLSALRKAAPQVSILLTSRRATGVAGEMLIDLFPLATASASEPGPPSDAARLFIAVGKVRDSRLQFVGPDMEAVESICRQLDGLPLAIDLVASRLTVMGPQAIWDNLRQHRRALLTLSNGHDAHHRTLQITIKRSYEAVTPNAQLLLQGCRSRWRE